MCYFLNLRILRHTKHIWRVSSWYFCTHVYLILSKFQCCWTRPLVNNNVYKVYKNKSFLSFARVQTSHEGDWQKLFRRMRYMERDYKTVTIYLWQIFTFVSLHFLFAFFAAHRWIECVCYGNMYVCVPRMEFLSTGLVPSEKYKTSEPISWILL